MKETCKILRICARTGMGTGWGPFGSEPEIEKLAGKCFTYLHW